MSSSNIIPITRRNSRRSTQSQTQPPTQIYPDAIKTNRTGSNPRSFGAGTPLPQCHLDTTIFQGTNFFELLDVQNLIEFVSYEFTDMYENMVNWFYDHVEIMINTEDNTPVGSKVAFVIRLRDAPNVVYTDKDLYDDFGLRTVGTYMFNVPTTWSTAYGLGKWEEIVHNLNRNAFGIYDNRQTSGPYTNFMSADDCALVKVLTEFLLPSTNKDTQLTKQDTLFLLKMKNRQKLNWPFLIADHMRESIGIGKKAPLPYCGLVCHIIKKRAPTIIGENKLRPSKAFNLTTLKLQGHYVINEFIVKETDKEKVSEEIKEILVAQMAERKAKQRKKAKTGASSSQPEPDIIIDDDLMIELPGWTETQGEGQTAGSPRQSTRRSTTEDERWDMLYQRMDAQDAELANLRRENMEYRQEHQAFRQEYGHDQSKLKKMVKAICKSLKLGCVSPDRASD